jgi:hypothetical protein
MTNFPFIRPLSVRTCFQAARLKGFAMGSGSGFDPRQSTDFYPHSPASLDARGMDRGGGAGDFEGMRMSMDGRVMVGTEKENVNSGSGNGSGNGRIDLPVVSESIRNLRTEKARYVQFGTLLRVLTRTDAIIHAHTCTYFHTYMYTHISTRMQ